MGIVLQPRLLLPAVLTVCAAVVGSALATAEPLALRVNDAEVRPGQNAVLVVRTYAPRPISQGQLFLGATSSAKAKVARSRGAEVLLSGGAAVTGASPFLSIVSIQVVSGDGDAVLDSLPSLQPTADGQGVMFDFSSLSKTVNANDGPLAIIELEMSPDVMPGDSFIIDPVPAESSIVGANGGTIHIDPRPGTLTVVSASAPTALGMDRADVVSGEAAIIGVSTVEPRPLAGATLVIHFDPLRVVGPVGVAAGPLQGALNLSWSVGQPGLLTVTLDSTDNALNGVPGTLALITFDTVPGVETGVRSALTFDVATHLDPAGGGASLQLVTEDGELNFFTDRLFDDGFESGDLSAWQP